MKRTLLLLLPIALACAQSNDPKRAPNGLDYNGCYLTSLEPRGEPIGAFYFHDGVGYIASCGDNCVGKTTPFTYRVNERTGEIYIYQSGKLWDSWRFVEKGLWKGTDKDSPYYHNYQ